MCGPSRTRSIVTGPVAAMPMTVDDDPDRRCAPVHRPWIAAGSSASEPRSSSRRQESGTASEPSARESTNGAIARAMRSAHCSETRSATASTRPGSPARATASVLPVSPTARAVVAHGAGRCCSLGARQTAVMPTSGPAASRAPRPLTSSRAPTSSTTTTVHGPAHGPPPRLPAVRRRSARSLKAAVRRRASLRVVAILPRTCGNHRSQCHAWTASAANTAAISTSCGEQSRAELADEPPRDPETDDGWRSDAERSRPEIDARRHRHEHACRRDGRATTCAQPRLDV